MRGEVGCETSAVNVGWGMCVRACAGTCSAPALTAWVEERGGSGEFRGLVWNV